MLFQSGVIMKKTYSQNVAWLFGAIDFLFLIPLVAGVLYSIPFFIYAGLMSLVSLFSKEFFFFGLSFFIVCFGLFTFISFGVRLMFDYFRHYKGGLTRKEVDRLWIKTIIYNAILFFPSLYINLQCWLTENCLLECHCNNSLQKLSEYLTQYSFLTFWWFLAIILSFTALASIKESEDSQKSFRLKI
jgi:hypothetical protein